MGYVLHLLVAFASLAVPAPQPLLEAAWFRWLWLGALGLPHGLAVGARWFALRGRRGTARRLERAVGLVGVGAQWGAVHLCGWGAWSDAAAATGAPLDLADPSQWPGPALLLRLVPFLAAEVLAIDARARLYAAGPALGGARGFQLRMLFSALAPFLLYLLLSGLVSVRESWRVHLEEVALLGSLATLLLLVLLVLGLPRFLVLAWRLQPLAPGPQRAVLEAVARRSGLACRRLCLWPTGGTMANAAVVGFSARSRTVVFTDALLASLDLRELAAVFAHELGHVRHGHARTFVVYALGLFFLADLVTSWLGAWSFEAQLALLGGIVAAWILGLGYLSRRFELEADLESLRWTGDGGALSSALWKVGGAHGYHRTGWRHFSGARRAGFLEAAVRDPQVARRLHRGVRRWARAGWALLLVALAAQLVLGTESLRRDRVAADLRLGRYEQARERWAAREAQDDGGAAERDAALDALLERAAGLRAEDRSAAALERLALAALRASEGGRASELLQLACLRGARHLVPVLERFEVLARGEEPDADSEPLPEVWSAVLAERFPRPSSEPGEGAVPAGS